MARKKTRKVRKGRVFLVLLVLSLFFFGVFSFVKNGNTKDEPPKVSNSNQEEPKEEIPVELPKERRMSLVMVGDALIHEVVYQDALKGGKYDFTSMLSSVGPLIQDYDLKYYNQETIIGGGTPTTYPRFNTPDAFADNMIATGFNLVSLANNHTLDKNESGILYSNQYWKKQENVVTSGTYSSLEERDTIPIYEQNGIKYAFLSYTMATNGLKAPKGKEYLVNVYSKELATKDVTKAKENGAEVILVAMHWGNEYTHKPNATQKEVASDLASLGVNLIIGAHPHVIQPISYVGNTLVIYSLGNFLSGHEAPTLDKTIGLLVGLDIVLDEENVVHFENIDKKLLYTYSSASRKNFKVYPFSELNDKILKNYASLEKEYLEIVDQKV